MDHNVLLKSGWGSPHVENLTLHSFTILQCVCEYQINNIQQLQMPLSRLSHHQLRTLFFTSKYPHHQIFFLFVRLFFI